jgi:hypothetical protein
MLFKITNVTKLFVHVVDDCTEIGTCIFATHVGKHRIASRLDGNV